MDGCRIQLCRLSAPVPCLIDSNSLLYHPREVNSNKACVYSPLWHYQTPCTLHNPTACQSPYTSAPDPCSAHRSPAPQP